MTENESAACFVRVCLDVWAICLSSFLSSIRICLRLLAWREEISVNMTLHFVFSFFFFLHFLDYVLLVINHVDPILLAPRAPRQYI